MCGIAGLVDFTGGPVDDRLLEEMTEGVRHRGPDSAATWRSLAQGIGVGLGHRRLCVIDLSEAGAQPMHNAACASAGRAAPLCIVFNGEVYNHAEIRRGLIERGHRLVSHSDTEVILHLYEEDGEGCLRHLRGMFALAIWDAEKRRLFCARDRVGKKPFYYRYDGRRFWFASEPRSILLDSRVPSSVNPFAVHSYLSLGYVPGPTSAHAALQRVPPGHWLLVDERGMRIQQYWRLERTPTLGLTEAAAAAELRRLLAESVKLRLTSDVPVGAFLSGGLDSSVVVAVMAAESPLPVNTFSIGFEDAAFNELPLARLVAQRYRTNHEELIVRADVASLLGRLAWHYGEPYADSSAVPTYLLARLVRSRITVALNGDGGDESFAGYARYWAHAVATRCQTLPASLRHGIAALAESLLRASSGRTTAYDLERFLAGASKPVPERYAGWFGFFDPGQMLTRDFAAAVGAHSPIASIAGAFERAAHLHPVDAAMDVDVATYLPDDLLVKVDIATMAHGLEARSPLLDHLLMEFAARLPRRMKRRGRRGKYLLRKVAADLLPPEILGAPKRGFGVPLDAWFRGELEVVARDLLLRPGAQVTAYVRRSAIEALLAEHVAGRRAHGHRLWALLMLEAWHNTATPATALAPESALHL